MDVAAQLAEQLDHHLRRVAPHPAAAPRPPRATN
jgi:hypothetical protein